jgi:hypothetical protein
MRTPLWRLLNFFTKALSSPSLVLSVSLWFFSAIDPAVALSLCLAAGTSPVPDEPSEMTAPLPSCAVPLSAGDVLSPDFGVLISSADVPSPVAVLLSVAGVVFSAGAVLFVPKGVLLIADVKPLPACAAPLLAPLAPVSAKTLPECRVNKSAITSVHANIFVLNIFVFIFSPPLWALIPFFPLHVAD